MPFALPLRTDSRPDGFQASRRPASGGSGSGLAALLSTWVWQAWRPMAALECLTVVHCQKSSPDTHFPGHTDVQLPTTANPASACPAARLQISLLRIASDGAVRSVADLSATVEEVAGTGDVLMVRLFEGEAAEGLGLVGPRASLAGASEQQRLQSLLNALVDVPVIMQTMPGAIKRAVMVSRA
jgi:hypothetical protein